MRFCDFCADIAGDTPEDDEGDEGEDGEAEISLASASPEGNVSTADYIILIGFLQGNIIYQTALFQFKSLASAAVLFTCDPGKQEGGA